MTPRYTAYPIKQNRELEEYLKLQQIREMRNEERREQRLAMGRAA